MLATVPLDSPVVTWCNALALAESVMAADSLGGSDSDSDQPTGPALDRIVRWLAARDAEELHAQRDDVLDTLDMIGPERSAGALRWLVRHAEDARAEGFWRQLQPAGLRAVA